MTDIEMLDALIKSLYEKAMYYGTDSKEGAEALKAFNQCMEQKHELEKTEHLKEKDQMELDESKKEKRRNRVVDILKVVLPTACTATLTIVALALDREMPWASRLVDTVVKAVLPKKL